MTRAVAERDAGLRRLGRLTRRVAAGAVGLTVALVGLAARATPGKAAARAPESVATDGSSDDVPGAVEPSTAPAATAAPTIATAPARKRRARTASTAPAADAATPTTAAPFVPPTQAPRPTHRAPVVVSGGS